MLSHFPVKVGTTMIVNTHPDEIVLPKHRHLCEMKPFSNADDPLEPLMINEVTYGIDSDQVDTKCMQTKNSYHQCESTNDSKPVLKTSILKPGAIQIH